MALPPAESPSTIYNSDFSGLLEEQSDNFPGKVKPSKAPFLKTESLAALAAKRALAETKHLPIIASASFGCSSKHSSKPLEKTFSVTGLTSVLPSLALVWPSNWGSGTLTLTIAVNPSRTSSPVKFWSFSFRILFFLA